MRHTTLTMFVLTLAMTFAVPTSAEEAAPETPPKRVLWRIATDNDMLSSSDNGYTAGWSIQRISPPVDSWDSPQLCPLTQTIGDLIPGLGDDGDGGRKVRCGWGVSQIMQTPDDITDPSLQLDDVPWAGTLGVHGTWSSIDDRRLNAFQLYLGYMGPDSFAEELQTFFHEDLDLRAAPEGWHTQLDSKLLVNLNYNVRRKLLTSPSVGEPGTFAADLSAGAQAGVGTFFNTAEVALELRWGWGLPEGFTAIPDPAGRGIVSEPIPNEPSDSWQVSFSLVPRYVYFADIATLDGGDTANGMYHPGVDYEDTTLQVIYGLHVQRGRFSAHLCYFYYPDDVVLTPTDTTLEWANLSIGYRF